MIWTSFAILASIYIDWHEYFAQGDDYFKNLLRDQVTCQGEEMFIKHNIGRWELDLDANHDIVRAKNKIHDRYRMQVELGIGSHNS
jgi:hypothetical protein